MKRPPQIMIQCRSCGGTKQEPLPEVLLETLSAVVKSPSSEATAKEVAILMPEVKTTAQVMRLKELFDLKLLSRKKVGASFVYTPTKKAREAFGK